MCKILSDTDQNQKFFSATWANYQRIISQPINCSLTADDHYSSIYLSHSLFIESCLCLRYGLNDHVYNDWAVHVHDLLERNAYCCFPQAKGIMDQLQLDDLKVERKWKKLFSNFFVFYNLQVKNLQHVKKNHLHPNYHNSYFLLVVLLLRQRQNKSYYILYSKNNNDNSDYMWHTSGK